MARSCRRCAGGSGWAGSSICPPKTAASSSKGGRSGSPPVGARPGDALYGEEGLGGNPDSDRQWIVDPIDGTVNFFYGIPHFCVSIALRVSVPLW